MGKTIEKITKFYKIRVYDIKLKNTFAYFQCCMIMKIIGKKDEKIWKKEKIIMAFFSQAVNV